MNWEKIMAGWLDPRTQRSTAFYALLGVLCSHIYHSGLDQWDLLALLALTGLGSASAILGVIKARKPPADPPGGSEARP